MVEKARRARVEESRPDADPEWEVLARESEGESLRYVGSVPAPDPEAAHAETTRLFCWFDDEVWLCPAGDVRKFSTAAAEDREPSVPDPSGEDRTHEL